MSPPVQSIWFGSSLPFFHIYLGFSRMDKAETQASSVAAMTVKALLRDDWCGERLAG
jgi:hypothetical protein